MTTIFIRTIIVYIILLSAMRFMGKRQIGELEVSDLITTLILSEIASLPITNSNIPISHAVIPIVILLTFEVLSSALLVQFPKIKNLISPHPTMLIKNGQLSSREMKKARITAEELISELRQNGISDISEVQYAILEQNGKISVIQKPEYKSPSAKDMRVVSSDSGLHRIIIENGYVDKHGLREAGLSQKEIDSILNVEKIPQHKVYLMTVNESGEANIILKDEK